MIVSLIDFVCRFVLKCLIDLIVWCFKVVKLFICDDWLIKMINEKLLLVVLSNLFLKIDIELIFVFLGEEWLNEIMVLLFEFCDVFEFDLLWFKCFGCGLIIVLFIEMFFLLVFNCLKN